MLLTNLDMDVLRTLVVATDLGGFVRAADRLGRSQSAISLQMRKLEDQVGQILFRKNGRGLALTDAGDILLGYARRILDLNDEAVTATRGVAIEGSVRIGLPQDLADEWLPGVLARFRRVQPNIHVEVRVGRNRELRDLVTQGQLDLSVAFSEIGQTTDQSQIIGELPMIWVGSRDQSIERDPTLSLALLDAPCMFRQAGIEALDRAGRAWRIGFTTPNLVGLWAAIRAGMGLSIRTPMAIPETLQVLGCADGLPALPGVQITLCGPLGRPRVAVDQIRAILVAELESIIHPPQDYAIAAE